MRKLTLLAALAAATAISTPALAGNPDGKWQVKVLGSGVLVDGKIDTVKAIDTNTPLGAAVAGTIDPQTDINDNFVPTVAIEYYATPNISVETICCLTQHHANGAGGLAGTNLINHVMILPATVTLKYHFNAGPIKPYVGVGPSVFFFINERPGTTAAALGVNRVHLSNKFGVAFQAGVDIPINKAGMGISLDAKKYLMKTTAHFYDNGAEALVTSHKLNPWVLSGGVYYRF